MKELLTSILLATFATKTLHSENANCPFVFDKCQSIVEAFSNEYARLEESVCGKLARCIDTEDPDTHIYMKTAGYIRTRRAIDLLCDNLGFPAKLPPSEATMFPRRWETTQIPFQGELKMTPEQLPAMGALEQIGLPLDKLLYMVDLHPKGVGVADVMADLSFCCGGEYYTLAVINHFPSNHWYGAQVWERASLYEDLGKPRNIFWEFSKKNVLYATNFDENVCARYDAMQTNLISRFAEERAASSPSITNIIAAMGCIRSLKALPVLAENLTICPQAITNSGAYIFPAVEAIVEIGPIIGYCFDKLEKAAPLSLEESMWLRISHELYPESLEYGLARRTATNDMRAARLLQSLPWRRLSDEEMAEP